MFFKLSNEVAYLYQKVIDKIINLKQNNIKGDPPNCPYIMNTIKGLDPFNINKGEPLKCAYSIGTIKGLNPFDTTKGDPPKCLYCIPHYYTMNNDLGLIRLEEVISLTTLSKSTIYRRLASNNFPPKLNCGSNIAAWKISDIKKYINGGLAWA